MAAPVQKQVVLPWSQVFKISFNSIRVRFFRSLITMMTLALAIAFVAFTQSGYDILNSVWPQADTSLRDRILSSGYELVQGRFGASPKDRWLVILSLLVSVVGIVNAQLMAVTERFREIGTFKCLGALNSFVVRIFLLEAVYQGLFGGLTGSVVGVLIATAAMSMKFGMIAVTCAPFAGILVTLVSCSFLAVFLSLLGVTYPALVAAGMQPAEALRAD